MIQKFVVIETVYPEVGSHVYYHSIARLIDDRCKTLSEAKKLAEKYNRTRNQGGNRIYHAEVR